MEREVYITVRSHDTLRELRERRHGRRFIVLPAGKICFRNNSLNEHRVIRRALYNERRPSGKLKRRTNDARIFQGFGTNGGFPSRLERRNVNGTPHKHGANRNHVNSRRIRNCSRNSPDRSRRGVHWLDVTRRFHGRVTSPHTHTYTPVHRRAHAPV